MNGLIMGRKKKYSEFSTNQKTDFCSWTTLMDEALIDAFVHQENIGNRVGNGIFSSHAYDNITRELVEKFKDKPLNKERIKNRIKYIKKNFMVCYEIFKNGLEGFVWNPVTKLWTAEPDDWDKLIEAHPQASEWMNKPTPHYDKLSLLYQKKENINQMEDRQMDNSSGEPAMERIDLIDGITLEALEGLPNPFEDESCSSKKRAKKANKNNSNATILKDGLEKLIEAINKCTAELVKSRQRLPIPEGQMWNLLVELGFEESVISTVYIFLIERPHMVGALLGCPPERRKDLLIQMAFGGSSSSSFPKP